MQTKVVVNTPSASIVQLKPATKLYPVISGQVSANLSLGQLTDVDLTNLTDNQTIIYHTASHKFTANTVLTTDYISVINGGSF